MLKDLYYSTYYRGMAERLLPDFFLRTHGVPSAFLEAAERDCEADERRRLQASPPVHGVTRSSFRHFEIAPHACREIALRSSTRRTLIVRARARSDAASFA